MALSVASLLFDVVKVVTALVVVIYGYFKWSYQYWKRRNVPYLEPVVPFGNLQNAYNRTLHESQQIASHYETAKARGWKYCGIYILATPNLLVTDLDLVKLILTKDFPHFVDRGFYFNEKDDPLSAHLFALGGTKWKNLRTKLTPTFTSGKMKAMFQTLADTGIILEKYIAENVANKGAVDIKELLGHYSTDIIGSCAFGIDCNSFKEPNSPFRVYGKKVFAPSRLETLKTMFATSFPDTARFLGINAVHRDVSSFYMKVVNDVVSYRENNNVTRKDFLQLLIDMKNSKGAQNGVGGDGQSLTMEELAAQCFVFFLAGFETSSTTSTFALFELAIHTEIQDKVRAEINSVLPKYDNKITYDALNELKYMRQVIDETLRKYPPVPVITRQCVQDYKVPGDNLLIKKGMTIIIPIWGIHYDQKYYKNPEDFDPDRFSEENKKNRHQYAHIPFGEGPRICIGERFGIMQTKVALTSILRNNMVTVDKRTKVPFKLDVSSLVCSVEGGVWLNFKKI